MAGNIKNSANSEPLQIINDSDDDSGESFVVLGTSMTFEDSIECIPSPTPIANSIIENAENLIQRKLLDVDTSPNAKSVMPTFTTEEEEKYIERILKENLKLKDIIKQNNATIKEMKDELEKILIWQKDVQMIYYSYKEKLNEAKNYYDTLRLENAKLKLEIGEHVKIKDLLNEEVLILKSRNLCSGNNTDNSDYLNTTETTIVGNCDHLNDLCVEKNELIRQNEELKKENEKLFKQNEAIQLNMIKSSDFDRKMIESLQEKLKNSAAQVKKLELELIMQKANFSEMERKKNNDIKKYRSRLSTSDDSKETISKLEEQLMNLQIQITKIQQELSDKEIAMQTKNNEIQEIRKKIEADKAQANNETFALKSQLEIYKSGYENERKNTMQVKENRDKISEDLKTLQRRNQDLHEEIELLRQNASCPTPSVSYTTVCPKTKPVTMRTRGPVTASPTTRTVNTEPQFSCPKCGLCLMTYHSLEDHVRLCLDWKD